MVAWGSGRLGVLVLALFIFVFESQADHVKKLSRLRNSGSSQVSLYPKDIGKSDELLGSFVQDPVTTTEHKSWFQRMCEALSSMVAGLLLVIPFSIALMWINERRNAELESVLSLGELEVTTIVAKPNCLEDSNGTLVHLNSENATGIDPVQDSRFPGVEMQSGCLRLRSCVEVFQWKEEVHTEKRKDRVGGGETTVKTYTYKKEWCTEKVDSSRFHQREHQNSCRVDGLAMGTREVVNGTVKYGEGFWLPREMVEQLNNFEDASKMAGESIAFGKSNFKHRRDGWYYYPESSDAPQVGDCRVRIEYVLDGPASILALLMKDALNADRWTFGPYRNVSRGFCCFGVADDALKKRRMDAAMKSADDIYEENRSSIPCMCCCNLVSRLFSAVGVPQIYSAYTGSLDAKECFEAEKTNASLTKWGLRLLGWLLLWVGLNMVFAPLPTFADIIPFLGPYLGSGLGWVLGVITFAMTLCVATLVISAAYLLYHPLIGVFYMLVAGGIFAGWTYVATILKQKGE